MKRIVVLLLLAACGTGPAAEDPDASPTPDAPSSDAAPTGPDAAAEGDAPPPLDATCTPLVGDVIVDHACLHVMHGPYSTTTAGTDPATVTANINMAHTHYTVELARDGDHHGGVFLYRPTQDGAHAFFVDPATPLQLSDPDGVPLPVLTRHEVTTCAGIASVVVAQLGRQIRYRVSTAAVTAPAIHVLVENLESFAPEDAWARMCP
jgi:hypothetical protein